MACLPKTGTHPNPLPAHLSQGPTCYHPHSPSPPPLAPCPLHRTRFSLLAALCRAQLWPSGSLREEEEEEEAEGRGGGAFGLAPGRRARPRAPRPDPHGAFFIDRDWWLFRHILAFLRSGTLPESEDVLQQLYAESSFYHLTSLRGAVEARCALSAMGTLRLPPLPPPTPSPGSHLCALPLLCHWGPRRHKTNPLCCLPTFPHPPTPPRTSAPPPPTSLGNVHAQAACCSSTERLKRSRGLSPNRAGIQVRTSHSRSCICSALVAPTGWTLPLTLALAIVVAPPSSHLHLLLPTLVLWWHSGWAEGMRGPAASGDALSLRELRAIDAATFSDAVLGDAPAPTVEPPQAAFWRFVQSAPTVAIRARTHPPTDRHTLLPLPTRCVTLECAGWGGNSLRRATPAAGRSRGRRPVPELTDFRKEWQERGSVRACPHPSIVSPPPHLGDASQGGQRCALRCPLCPVPSPSRQVLRAA